MNENNKTITFITIAVALVLVAWLSQPHDWSASPNKQVGERLTADFDPLSAASLEIVQYDETTATVHPFLVALVDVNGKRRWSIPSHDDYPADADRQVALAATALMGLEILNVEGDTQADQEKFGVVDPDPKSLKVGATGVGMKVTIRDKEDKDLVSLIIGKEVPDRPGLRYVRRAGQDPIYTMAVKTDNFSTKFDNWIEKNLLKMNPWDIDQLTLRDYSTALMMDEQGRVGVEKQNRGEMVLEFADQAQPHWKLIEDRKVNDDGTFSPNKMADDEELNVAKLDEMKNALNDLKIVDVARKPKGLSADLKASADFTKNQESILTLASRGFIVARAGDHVEVCSKEGEVRSLMKDGVEYVLRFGDVTGGSAESSKKDETGKDQKEGQESDEKKPSAGMNRYLFVMVEFNPDAIPKPQLEPLPEEKPETEQQAAAEVNDTVKAEGKADETKKTPTDEESEKGEKGMKGEKGAKGEKGDEKDAEKSSMEAQRQRIEKENKRKQDEYDEKIAAGRKHVEELNARFADWYYIISNDVYRKIHLG
ncbi:MAG TPA: DUF4340 domain-containing protein, partial [Thermoguttaceae bacterium]